MRWHGLLAAMRPACRRANRPLAQTADRVRRVALLLSNAAVAFDPRSLLQLPAPSPNDTPRWCTAALAIDVATRAIAIERAPLHC